jgi:histidinol-phosphate aminotransferase
MVKFGEIISDMTTNRRDWLKTAILGGTALVFSPLEILAKEIPNYKEIIQNADVIRLCFNENPFGTSPKLWKRCRKALVFRRCMISVLQIFYVKN